MSSKVYFLPVDKKTSNARTIDGLNKILAKEDINGSFSGAGLTAIKMHFGEPDNPSTVHPDFIRAIADAAKKAGSNPFLAETNTLYAGRRSNSIDHVKTAYYHGYSMEMIGAPVIILDGIGGKNFIEVEVDGEICKTAKIAKDILSIDNLVAATHITGHILAGFGGSIKNIGMGMASRGGKQIQHSGILPEVDADTCTACGECAKWCPVHAIRIEDVAAIDKEICIGCGECTATCRFKAVNVRWDESSVNLQKKMAEYACAVLKNIRGKSCFLNFLIKVTKDCDCMNIEQTPRFDSIGIVVSTDIVACDQAALDLMEKTAGEDIIDTWFGTDGTIQIEHAEKIGLGTRSYDLETV